MQGLLIAIDADTDFPDLRSINSSLAGHIQVRAWEEVTTGNSTPRAKPEVCYFT